MESYRANDARLKMREILSAVERGEHIELKRYDTPTGVIVPLDWYERAKAALRKGEG
jgi:antitoxin (DNA-binding transcriptional repressor) of toxin-antitoxin stability system